MKKVVSLFMAFVMLFSITAGLNMSASAKTVYASDIVSYARSFKGYPYVTNTHGPNSFDCSGFVYYVYNHFGISMSTASSDYWKNPTKYGTKVSGDSNAKAGDIVVWSGHVGICIGNGKMINALGPGYGVCETKITEYRNGSGTINPSHFYIRVKGVTYSNNGSGGTTSSVTITFNGNGGTPSASSVKVLVGSSMGRSIPTATRSGYVFDGWYTAASGGTKYSNTTTITSGNKTLYAHWINNLTYGIAGNLKLDHIYRIINKKSRYALESNGSGDGALVRQQPISNSNKQLWRLSALAGGCVFQNLYGRKCLDIKSSSMDNGAQLQVYGTSDNGKSNRIFSIIPRTTGYYSIHPNHSGRALDITNASTSAGAQVQQYYYNGSDNQLFYFEEVTDRNIIFYDNLSNNYLPTPREEYTHSGSSVPKSCFISRNTDYVTTSINATQNKLIINAKKAGSSGNDMTFATTINGSYNYDMYDSNTNKMYLGFTAKSSVQGAKIYFRWGYDSTSSYKSVTLNTTATNYLIELPRTLDSGSNIHPYVDRACTIEMTNIQLKSDPNASISFSYGDTYSYQSKTYNVNNVTYGTLPQPKTTKNGYTFDGWYTDRIGGTKVTLNSKINYNTKLYAHWKKDESAHTHTYGSGKVTKAATTSSAGTITYTCTKCSATKTETIAKISTAVLSKTSYTYDGNQKNPTVTVKDSAGKTLTKGTDYTITYSTGRTNVGTYNVTVNYKGKYNGSTKLSFKVIQQIPSRCTPKLSKTSYTYDGNEKNPTVTIKDVVNNVLVQGRDYTLTYDSGRTNAGTYNVKITYKGNYSGTDTVSFKVIQQIPSRCTATLSTTSTYYNGSVKTPGVTVKDVVNNTLKNGTDYTVTMDSGRKNVGRYAVKITYKGNYSGSQTLYFNVIPRGVSKISKITASSKGFTVQWDKQTTQTTGYQIQYSTSSNFSNAKTITMPKTSYYAKKITGLSSNKKYYVRVRTYKTTKFNGKNYNVYSYWCATKSITTKR